MSGSKHPWRSPSGSFIRSPAGARDRGARDYVRDMGPDGWRLESATLSIIHGLISVQGGNLAPRSNLFEEYLDCSTTTAFFPEGLQSLIQGMLNTTPFEDSGQASAFTLQDCDDASAVVDGDTPVSHPTWDPPVPRDVWTAPVVDPCYYAVTEGAGVADATGVAQFTPHVPTGLTNLMQSVIVEDYDSSPTELIVDIEAGFNNGNSTGHNRYNYDHLSGSGGEDEPDKLTPPAIVLFAPAPERLSGSPQYLLHSKALCVFELASGLIQRWSETPGGAGLGRLCGTFVCRVRFRITRV